MLQAVLSMFHSVQSILKSMQKQEDVYEEFVGQQDVTKEILEDGTKEIMDEEEREATLILPQPLFGSGCGKL